MTVTIHANHELSKSPEDTSEATECCGENETCCTTAPDLKENLENANKESSAQNGSSKTTKMDELDRINNTKSTSSSNNNNLEKLKLFDEYDKYRRLLFFHEAPKYLAHNKYILSGYRGILNTKLCIESVFWWTNETINIWSHVFGFLLFFSLTMYDLLFLNVHAHLSDKIIVGNVLICFQICMILSSMYHTFSCRSEHDFDCFLSFDLFGIALSLLAIYMSGIYFAFWCSQYWQTFYLVTVTLIFMFAMSLQLKRFSIDSNVKTGVFVAWAAYGVVPTLHWTITMGGFSNPVVALLLPRVLGMYLISGTAFAIYITKIPERFSAGRFDYLGHSHQWWHVIIVLALYYWHNSGIMYVNYRINHSCPDTMRFP